MLYALHDSNIGACMNGRVNDNLRFADDIVLLAESEEDLQSLVSDVFKFSSQLGLKISFSKTQVQVIGTNSTQINTQIENHALEQVKSFIYPEGQIDEDGTSQNDVIGIALGAMHTLHPSGEHETRATKLKSSSLSPWSFPLCYMQLKPGHWRKEIKIDSSHLRCHASDEFWASAEGTRSVTTAFVNNLAWNLPSWTESKRGKLHITDISPEWTTSDSQW